MWYVLGFCCCLVVLFGCLVLFFFLFVCLFSGEVFDCCKCGQKTPNQQLNKNAGENKLVFQDDLKDIIFWLLLMVEAKLRALDAAWPSL